MKIGYVVLSLAAIFASTGCTAQSAIPANPAGSQSVQTDHSPTTQPMLNDLLNQLRSQVTPEQYQAFSQAVESSPPLSDQLNSLIEKGLLQRITIVDAPQGNWRAWRDGSKWVFVAGFVHDLTPHRLYDVVRKDDILPDNIAFVLGYLAWHTAHAEQLERATQTLNASNLSPKSRMDQWVDLRIGADAGAFIQGWNDMVSGATKQNQGKPLTAMQLANLTMNFMFREPFLVGPLAQHYESLSAEQKKILDQVSKQPYASAALYHLDMTPDGIPMDQRNIDAMKMSLGRSHVIPVQP